MQENTKFLNGGHPIFCIQVPSDIALFDNTSGLGSGIWSNFAYCDGQMQEDSITGLQIQTPPLLDKFVIAAGSNYSVNDTGGSETVTLDVSEMPTHNHPLTDNGHTHDIQDPGHNHGASSASHSHSFTPNPHSHVAGDEGSHTHNLASVFSVDYNGGTGPFRTGAGFEGGGTNYSGDKTLAGSPHTHDISEATASGTIGGTSAAVTVQDAFTGIGETETADSNLIIGNSGDGAAHDNMPPYYCLIYVMKL